MLYLWPPQLTVSSKPGPVFLGLLKGVANVIFYALFNNIGKWFYYKSHVIRPNKYCNISTLDEIWFVCIALIKDRLWSDFSKRVLMVTVY